MKQAKQTKRKQITPESPLFSQDDPSEGKIPLFENKTNANSWFKNITKTEDIFKKEEFLSLEIQKKFRDEKPKEKSKKKKPKTIDFDQDSFHY
jgi:hypothetical protein